MTNKHLYFQGMGIFAALLLFTVTPAQGQPWVSFDTHTRYVALGDSISAGYGAKPVTQGFTYDIYQSGVIDKIANTLFCQMAVPGALTEDVLNYQVPQVGRFFQNTGQPYRKVITLTVGANDLLAVLGGADPVVVIDSVAKNIGNILGSLTTQYPDATIYIGNYYDPQLPFPNEDQLIKGLNYAISFAAGQFPNVSVVDVYSEFQGRSGLLLSEKHNSDFGQIHPSNAGYRVIAKAFEDAIRAH
jgi:lysophospholipase L1-like esterase